MSTESPGLVTVVIATYNMGRYLPLAVESVLGQTYPHVQVQIVDDGSTDETPAIAERLAADPRVRVHRQPNGGQAKAKNVGIALSRSPFVAFLDADDMWLPRKLEHQMPLFENRPQVGVVYSDYERMDGDGNPVPKGPVPMFRGRISGRLLIDNFVSFPSAIVRRECFDRFGTFDETFGMGIDYDLWLRLSAHYEFDFIAEPTIRYRIWAGQMSKNFRQRYASAIRIMQRFLDNNPGVVARDVVNVAWAHTYAGRGDYILWRERKRAEALRDYFRAVSYKPGYWPAWRAIARSFITARPPRDG